MMIGVIAMGNIVLSGFELTRFFFAIVLLLSAAHGFGYFFQRILKTPKVIGEIVGGLVLGPTVLGYLAPSVYEWIFNAFASEGQLIAIVYWIGLVLLMFISGFEIQKSMTHDDKRLIGTILIGSTCIPFVVGWFVPDIYDFSSFVGEKGNIISLTIVIAIAIAVTSIPVISKIFIDLDIAHTRFAKIVLATATIEDVVLWVALTVATGLANGNNISFSIIAGNVVITLGFFVVGLFFLPKLFDIVNRHRLNLFIKSSATGYVLSVCFMFAAIASVLNVNIIFGAFLAGVVVGMLSDEKIVDVKIHIREMGLGFFIPIYFAVVGLKLDLIHNLNVPFLCFFLCIAVLIKTLGTVFAAKVARQNWRASFNYGVAMNARGGPGIVLATVAFELGIINESFFVVLVLIAIITSLMAGYWFRYVLAKGWDLSGERL